MPPPTESSLLAYTAAGFPTEHCLSGRDTGPTFMLADLKPSLQGWCLFLDFDGTFVDFAVSSSGVTKH